MTDSDNTLLEQIGEFDLFLRYFLFAFTQAKEMSFHLLVVQMVMKHLIFFPCLTCFFPLLHPLEAKNQTNKPNTNQPKITN